MLLRHVKSCKVQYVFRCRREKKRSRTATKPPPPPTVSKKRAVFHVFTFETIANRTQRLRIQNTGPNILKICLGKVAEGRAGNSRRR